MRTIALVVEGVVPGFVLLSGRAGDAYTLVKDVFEVLVLVGVAMAVARRAFARPPPPRPDDATRGSSSS